MERADSFLAGEYHLSGEEGSFLVLGPNGDRLTTSDRISVIQHWLKSEVAIDLIRANRRFIWLHASGVARDGRAVLLTGPSGRGKSTLSTDLCRRGWKYLGDDMLPMDPESGTVLPFPATAMRRRAEAKGTLLTAEEVNQLERDWVDMDREAVASGPADIAAIVLPEFHPEAGNRLEASSGGAAAAELLSGCINFIEHRRDAIVRLCGLIESVPVHHLAWSDPDRAVESILEAHG